MATFQIHEDKENYQRHVFQHTKKFYNGKQDEKKVVNKKQGAGNRSVLQPVDNSIRQAIKKVKLTAVREQKEFKVEKIDKASVVLSNEDDLILDNPLIDVSFLKIDAENNTFHTKEKEITENKFPVSLLFNEEYRKDIWEYLSQAERSGPISKSSYMPKQADLSWSTRAILVDWLASVADEYKFCEQTFHLSVNYVDRFLTQISVARSKFQLVGAAAMMLAGKLEEYYPVDAKEWAYLTGDSFSVRQVLKMERLIVKILRFRMQPPTIYGFIELFCAEHRMDSRTMHLATYISELALLEGEDYLDHLPSKLAAAAVALARHTLSKTTPWPSKLKKMSGYSLKELSPVVQRQQRTLVESPLKQQQAVTNKYKSEKYHRVALLKPRVLDLEDLEDEE